MSASDSTHGAAVPRRAGTAARSRPAYINVWLLAILLLGSVIVLIDGATRAPLNDALSYASDALAYDPYVAVYLFAAVTLPLVFVWARSLRASKTEALLLWFLLGTTAYTRDFAYVKVPGAPLYCTDVVLMLLALSVFVCPRLRLLPLPPPYTLFCLPFP